MRNKSSISTAVVTSMVALCLAGSSSANSYLLDLLVNKLVYDDARGVIYGSVPGNVPKIGNTIAVIDPDLGIVSSTFFIGSNPSVMTLSGSRDNLYVGLDGSARVARYNLATGSHSGAFVLGSDPFHGPMFAEDIAVIPGTELEVVVSREYAGVSPRHAGVAAYDAGVMRPIFTPDHTGSNVIEFGESSGRLYGYNTETSEDGFRRMDVGPSGVEIISVNPFSLGDDIVYHSGRIIGTSGIAIEPEPSPSIIGTYAATGRMVVDSGYQYVYFIKHFGAPALTVCDLNTFAIVRTLPLPAFSGSAQSIVRWGRSGLAFNTNQGDIVFIKSSDVWRQVAGTLGALFVSPGVINQGSLSSILTSDDQRLVLNPGIVFSTSQPPVRVSLTATLPHVADDLSLRIESSGSSASIRQTVFALNRVTNQFEQIDEGLLSTTDQTRVMDIHDIALEFIEPSSKEVDIRIEYKAIGPVFVYPWQARIDQIRCLIPQN